MQQIGAVTVFAGLNSADWHSPGREQASSSGTNAVTVDDSGSTSPYFTEYGQLPVGQVAPVISVAVDVELDQQTDTASTGASGPVNTQALGTELHKLRLACALDEPRSPAASTRAGSSDPWFRIG
jgi:hypothetical protein